MAANSLSTPLLSTPKQTDYKDHLILTVNETIPSSQIRICNGSDLISKNHRQNGEVHVQFDEKEVQNPYEFLGSSGFEVPEPPTVDPFRNNTPKIEGVYEWLKIVVCLPIALIRLFFFGFFLMVGYVATTCALHGWKERENPMPKWRSRIMWITRLCTRCILFSFGYHWIRRKGRPAPREIAPIVVSNHVSYVDPIFFFYELFPTIVASESHDSMPFVGTIIRAMQVIYVDRFSKTSRKDAVNEIKRRASRNRFPRVLLFPEGTTSNGRVIISFELGAFIPGYPIQPVVVRYPHVHFDQSWGNVTLAQLMFRMFTQFHNFMEIEYLPVVSPLENTKESASQFAQRASHAIATSLNVVQTSHSYGDVLLYSKASELKQENPSLYLVEMAWIKKSLSLSSLEAVDLLEIFLQMKPNSRGQVEIHNFLHVLRLKCCALSEKIFQFIDVQKMGKITFKEFLIGSAHILKQPGFLHACDCAFGACDINNQNYVSEQELADSVKPAIPTLNAEEITRLFTLFDVDGDGKISKDDFTSCLQKNPLLIAIFSPLLQCRNYSSVEEEVGL